MERRAQLAELFCLEQGAGGTPVALLHGFGGSHAVWSDVVTRIGDARRLLAFDLPGHADSLAVPSGSAVVAAKAVLTELSRRGIERAHLVGHSMGGATAALIALRDPARVASLTLLAPGGFGPEVNQALLRRYAAAVEEGELAASLKEFFAAKRALPKGFAAEQARGRQVAGATAALVAIVETFFDGAAQKTLPLADLAHLGIPIAVAWGTEDRVVPASQARGLPGNVVVRIFERVGHMLPLEIPDDVAKLVLETSREQAAA